MKTASVYMHLTCFCVCSVRAQGWSPAHSAASKDYANILQSLHNGGADLGAADMTGKERSSADKDSNCCTVVHSNAKRVIQST
jgi:hypothetical protein